MHSSILAGSWYFFTPHETPKPMALPCREETPKRLAFPCGEGTRDTSAFTCGAETQYSSAFQCGAETPLLVAFLKGSDYEILSCRVQFVTKIVEKVRTVISAESNGLKIPRNNSEDKSTWRTPTTE